MDTRLEAILSDNVISPSPTDYTAYLTYNFNTTLPVTTLSGIMSGRVISADIVAGPSYIEIFAAGKDQEWTSIYKTPALTTQYGNSMGDMNTQNAFDASAVALGKSSVYLMFVMRNYYTGGANTWVAINGLGISTTTDFRTIASANVARPDVLTGASAATALGGGVAVATNEGGVQ
jgi:hypothetical protein